MTISQNKIKSLLLSFKILVILFLSFILMQTYVEAATISATLTVNGGANASVINGSEVTLDWEIIGSPTNCRIIEKTTTVENIIVPNIDTTLSPTPGTYKFTPQDNTEAEYSLVCDQVIDVVVVDTTLPVVNISIDEGINLTANPTKGYVDKVTVRWNSYNTNSCSEIKREKASALGTFTVENDSTDNLDMTKTSGDIIYDGSPRSISETTTFYITCYNDVTGEEVTNSIKLNVSNSTPPPAVTLSISAYGADVSGVTKLSDGKAYLTLWRASKNATQCVSLSYYENGELYSNPIGFTPVTDFSAERYHNPIIISTTTRFQVTCNRAEVTIDGITYPEDSVTRELLIKVLDPVVSRDSLPAVEAFLTAVPTTVFINPLTGKGTVLLTRDTKNADYCDRFSYDTNGTPSDYADDVQISTITGWKGTGDPASRMYSNRAEALAVQISIETRFELVCVREYDLDPVNGNFDLGTERVSVVVGADNSIAAPDPAVDLYAHPVVMTADMIFNSQTASVHFDTIRADGASHPRTLYNTSGGALTSSISFPFTKPVNAVGKFDAYLKVCDENDGVSTFRLYTASGGLLGSAVTDDKFSIYHACVNSTIKYKKIASDFEIADGETITLECDQVTWQEKCRLVEIIFGISDSVETPIVDSSNPSEDVPLYWISTDTNECAPFDAAMVDSGYAYDWWTGSKPTVGILSNNKIATTTDFSISCRRTTAGFTGTVSDSLLVNVPVNAPKDVQAEAYISAGQCRDDGTFGTPELFITAPDGYQADVSLNNNYCIPAISLEADLLNIGLSNPDSVNGVYNNATAQLTIKNYGPGMVGDTVNIPYRFTVEYDSRLGLPDYNSPIYHFNGTQSVLNVPVPPEKQSSTLTQSFGSIAFGDHRICVEVNNDGVIRPETYKGDNSKCTNQTVPVPQPPMEIKVNGRESGTLIRNGGEATVSWSANTSYPLECSLKGIGMSSVLDFDASDTTNNTSSLTVPNIKSAGKFVLQCTEPITGTVFTKTADVSVVPESIEN